MAMYTDEEGEIAVRAARAVVEAVVRREPIPSINFPSSFDKPAGAFTTINTYPERMLRGCIGFPGPYYPLKDSIVKSARDAASSDPRFYPVGEDELDRIVVEVSILTPPRLIEVKNSKEYLKSIKIGRDGLIVQKGMDRGLLLPQVPVEERWNVREFLAYTCRKAGLSEDCWKDKKTKIFSFAGEVFEEEKPRGNIRRKEL
jgi:uncharacterized protein (TIGR00296 family)